MLKITKHIVCLLLIFNFCTLLWAENVKAIIWRDTQYDPSSLNSIMFTHSDIDQDKQKISYNDTYYFFKDMDSEYRNLLENAEDNASFIGYTLFNNLVCVEKHSEETDMNSAIEIVRKIQSNKQSNQYLNDKQVASALQWLLKENKKREKKEIKYNTTLPEIVEDIDEYKKYIDITATVKGTIICYDKKEMAIQEKQSVYAFIKNNYSGYCFGEKANGYALSRFIELLMLINYSDVEDDRCIKDATLQKGKTIKYFVPKGAK